MSFKSVMGPAVPDCFVLSLGVLFSDNHSFSLLVGLQSAFCMGYHTLPINFDHSVLFRVIKVGEWMINDMMIK